MSWGAPTTPSNPNNDFLVANPPNDGISSLEWSPTGNFLVATAWDGDVRFASRPRIDSTRNLARSQRKRDTSQPRFRSETGVLKGVKRRKRGD